MLNNQPIKDINEIVSEAKSILALTEPMDFEKIAAHDPQEINKLNKAILDLHMEAKEEKNQQPQNLIDNVPEEINTVTDLMPKDLKNELDKNNQNTVIVNNNKKNKQTQNISHQQQTTSTINAAGMDSRLGNYYNGYNNAIEPLSNISHQRGLPKFDACISPDYSPSQSNHCIFITDSGVISAIITKPIKTNEWKVLQSAPYNTTDEMIKLITQYITKNDHEV